jgi:hypothetical protein
MWGTKIMGQNRTLSHVEDQDHGTESNLEPCGGPGSKDRIDPRAMWRNRTMGQNRTWSLAEVQGHATEGRHFQTTFPDYISGLADLEIETKRESNNEERNPCGLFESGQGGPHGVL